MDTVTGMFLFAFVLLSKIISQIQVRWSGLTRNVYFYASGLKLLDDPGWILGWFLKGIKLWAYLIGKIETGPAFSSDMADTMPRTSHCSQGW